jgi:holin-like protein
MTHSAELAESVAASLPAPDRASRETMRWRPKRSTTARPTVSPSLRSSPRSTRPLLPMHRDFLARDPRARDPKIELAAEAAGQSGTHEIANTMIAGSAPMVGASAPHRSRIVHRRLEQAALVALQLTGLWALNFAGVWAVQQAALPIPGNLLGMLALYALLALGVVKLAWFDLTGSFLLRHLAFFFVPITVGLMNSGPLLLAHGLAIMLVLTLSAAVGILLAGFVSQVLLAKPWQRGGKS